MHRKFGKRNRSIFNLNEEEIMVYVGISIYVVIGLLFAALMWANFAIHCKKYLKVALFSTVIALSWGYGFIGLIMGMLGELIAHLITKKGTFILKIPIALYIMMLDKMYQSLYGEWGGQFLETSSES